MNHRRIIIAISFRALKGDNEMNEEINTETLKQLIAIHRDDPEMTEIITEALESFEKYHQAIYSLEIRRALYAQGAISSETYREVVPELDGIRTRRHNVLLSEVNMLNRLAEQAGLPPFYPGEVSEERPIRTWVADAVLDYVRQVIDDRVTGGR